MTACNYPVEDNFPPPKATASKVTPSKITPTAVCCDSNAMLVVIDKDVSAEWKVEEAMEIWNNSLPCDYFLTEGKTDRVLYITEVYLPNQDWAGENTATSFNSHRIELNEWYDPDIEVSLHEFGHSLELDHSNTGIMVEAVQGLDHPTAQEVALAGEWVVC